MVAMQRKELSDDICTNQINTKMTNGIIVEDIIDDLPKLTFCKLIKRCKFKQPMYILIEEN